MVFNDLAPCQISTLTAYSSFPVFNVELLIVLQLFLQVVLPVQALV